LEIKDISRDPPILVDKIELQEDEGGLMDFDFYKDETNIIVGFRGDVANHVNIKTKAIHVFNHRLPHPLVLVQFLKHFEGGEPSFITMSKGGVYRIWNMDYKCQEIAKFHPT
jgi:hypothetical protein